jgi:flagellar hook-associated protein 3 FlgL
MRIATSTIYQQQVSSIDNLQATYANIGNQLSTGKSLNGPSDDPTQIGQDLGVRTTLAGEAQQGNNVQGAVSQLTTTDSALASVTSVLQSARTLAVQGATDELTLQQRQSIGNQVDELLQQTVATANTNFGGTYIFAGSAPQSTPPITPQGNPINSVSFSGNNETQGQLLYNGQSFALSTTMQQSFNLQAADGSPSVFQVLSNLRNTINNGLVVDQSAASINQQGTVIYGNGTPSGPPGPVGPGLTTLGASKFATPLQSDNAVPAGEYSITINNADASGVQHVNTYTFKSTDTIDGGAPPLGSANSVVGEINANFGSTGLTASFDQKTQKLVLTNAGGGAFFVSDVPSPGATTTSNFTTTFGLQGQADLPQTISTQLGDIDNALNVVLNARSVVGARINALSTIGDQLNQNIVDNTQEQSNIEDVDVAKATANFTQTQTALQAAFATTTRLEGKTLFDYLS